MTHRELAEELATLAWRMDDGSLTDDEAEDAVITLGEAVKVLRALAGPPACATCGVVHESWADCPTP